MSTIKVFSAYSEQLIEEIPRTTKKEAFDALETAYQLYQDRDSWLPASERIAILEKALKIFKTRKKMLVTTAAEEGGKPYMDSDVEVERAMQGIKVAIAAISQLKGEEIPMRVSDSSANRIAYTFREPGGVVLAISAFNHPVNLIIHQVIPAIAVGCPVLVKPASSTPLSCLNVIKILHEAGLPKEWCQVLLMPNDVAEKMVADPRISFMTFIGSGKVGWYLRSKLAAGAHCSLEHGGAAPVIVEQDADIGDMLPLLVKGGFYHAGQVCVSVQRVYAHESLCKLVADSMAEMADKLVVGDPIEPTTEVGPLISPKEVDRVEQWVNEAKARGAKILCGGKRLSTTCYAPTVVLNPPSDIALSTHEIFGPVVCVYSYKDRQNAITQANSLPFSFQASVFTKNIDVALDTVQRLNAEAVMVNDHTAFRVDWMPFGGRKESGLGKGGIAYAMHDMSHEKLMVIRSKLL